MPDVSWLAVLVAALATFLLGGLWYGPLFGKHWLRASGVDETRLEGGAGLIFGLSFVLQLIAAAVLAMFIGPDASFGFAVAAAAAVGACWVATAFGVVYLFERRPLGHWALNAGYNIIAYLVMGAILGAWP